MKDIHYYKTHVKKGNPFIYYGLLFPIKWYIYHRCRVKVDKTNIKSMKGPFILVFNHASKLDFVFSFFALWRIRMNAMIAYAYFCQKNTAWIFHQLGGFPKYLHAADISAIKNAIKVFRRNGVLGVAPEGRLSPHGALESIIPSTAKFIKKMKVDVYINKIEGGYMALPKWSNTIRRGRVDVNYQLLFSKNDIESLSETEIFDRLNQAMQYDDFTWQEKNKVPFKGKRFAEGLEHILYICPICKKMYTIKTKDNHLECQACGMKATLNPYYTFESDSAIPANIRDWYMFQKDFEAGNDLSKVAMKSKVILKFPTTNVKGFEEVGQGTVLLNAEGLTYEGTIRGNQTKVLFKIDTLSVILFGVNEDFEIYKDDTLYYFIPENIRECVRYSVLAEALYNYNLNRK